MAVTAFHKTALFILKGVTWSEEPALSWGGKRAREAPMGTVNLLPLKWGVLLMNIPVLCLFSWQGSFPRHIPLLPHGYEGSGGAEVCYPRGAHRNQCGNGCPEGWEPACHCSAKPLPVNHELGETVCGEDVPRVSGVELSCERLEQWNQCCPGCN